MRNIVFARTGNGPDFLYVAPSTTACAAFSKESRMKFANANELHRKSGGRLDQVQGARVVNVAVKRLGKSRRTIPSAPYPYNQSCSQLE
jgi:hypothetical protein